MGKKLLPTSFPGRVESSVWFEFFDSNGRGVCEADHIIICPDRVVVVECKLTQTPRGLFQLEKLYLPLVEFLFPEVRVQGVMICKTLYKEPEYLVTKWRELSEWKGNEILTWHWLGR